MQRDPSKSISLAQQENAKFCIANPYRILQHGLKHRLQLARRAADDFQHVSGGGLLLQ